MKIEPITHKIYGLFADHLKLNYYYYILDYQNPSNNQIINLPFIKGQHLVFQVDSKTDKLYLIDRFVEKPSPNNVWIADPLKLKQSNEIKTNIARKN